MIPFNGTRCRRPFDALGGLSSIGAEEHGQPGDRALVIFSFATYIANPRREVRHGDQLFAQPCEIGNVAQMHNASGTFVARVLGAFGFGVRCQFNHGLRFGGVLIMADHFPFGWGPINQHSFADDVFYGEQAPLV